MLFFRVTDRHMSFTSCKCCCMRGVSPMSAAALVWWRLCKPHSCSHSPTNILSLWDCHGLKASQWRKGQQRPIFQKPSGFPTTIHYSPFTIHHNSIIRKSGGGTRHSCRAPALQSVIKRPTFQNASAFPTTLHSYFFTKKAVRLSLHR